MGVWKIWIANKWRWTCIIRMCGFDADKHPCWKRVCWLGSRTSWSPSSLCTPATVMIWIQGVQCGLCCNWIALSSKWQEANDKGNSAQRNRIGSRRAISFMDVKFRLRRICFSMSIYFRSRGWKRWACLSHPAVVFVTIADGKPTQHVPRSRRWQTPLFACFQ